MGMYTEIALFVDLKPNTASDVLDILESLTSPEEDVKFPNTLPDHPFFKCDRWKWICTMGSCYFYGPTMSEFNRQGYTSRPSLGFRANLKNYDGEIQHFLSWITPYVQPDGFAGYFHYEEDHDPTLIYFEHDGLTLYRCDNVRLPEAQT